MCRLAIDAADNVYAALYTIAAPTTGKIVLYAGDTGATVYSCNGISVVNGIASQKHGTRCVLAFTSSGTRLGCIGPAVAGYGNIVPEAVAVDPTGPIFVGDNTQQRVLVLGSPATAVAPAAWSAVRQLFR